MSATILATTYNSVTIITPKKMLHPKPTCFPKLILSCKRWRIISPRKSPASSRSSSGENHAIPKKRLAENRKLMHLWESTPKYRSVKGHREMQKVRLKILLIGCSNNKGGSVRMPGWIFIFKTIKAPAILGQIRLQAHWPPKREREQSRL